jgi:hypothetical protein
MVDVKTQVSNCLGGMIATILKKDSKNTFILWSLNSFQAQFLWLEPWACYKLKHKAGKKTLQVVIRHLGYSGGSCRCCVLKERLHQKDANI